MLKFKYGNNEVEFEKFGQAKTFIGSNGGVEYFYKKFFADNRKCVFCQNEIRLKTKIVDDNNIVKIINTQQNNLCYSSECYSNNVNPRSYEWLTKVKGMTEEEARNYSVNISKKSFKNRKAKQIEENPYSKEYWLSKGLSEDEAQSKVNSRNRRKKEFWLKRGYDEENAINMAKFHSSTWNLEYLMYFKGYSEEKALDILKQNSKILSDSAKNNINILKPLRKSSIEANSFFKDLYEKTLKTVGILEEEIYTDSFGKNKEWFVREENNIYFYDFCIPSLGIVIEYNGIHVHPKNLNDLNWKHAYSKEDAQTVYDREEIKKQIIKDKFGFDSYFVLFSDESKEEFILKFDEFIKKELERF